jgi:diaminohydroxyphosphoribosylaminopyrimidine deaminase / 5-amino-6-(5-phosphoribosylamino)uracil reductase
VTRSDDIHFMQRAMALAREGIALASPNPYVGAVVVSQSGEVVGEGMHIYANRKHGEILALEQAGERARGGTLYLNLEPCSHTGRTGPCADAVIAAGVARVVAAMRDPNPLVAGKGFEKLRAAGIEVVEGLLEEEARKLNEAFAKFITTRMPFVILKAGMTLDGKLGYTRGANEVDDSKDPLKPKPGFHPSRRCAPSGDPGLSGAPSGHGEAERWITSEASRAHAQRELRHSVDAILVGIGTVLADDPVLTDRTGMARGRPLLRVVLDSKLRLPLNSQLVKSAAGDVIVFHSYGSDEAIRELEARGVLVEQIAADASGHPEIATVLRRLGELDLLSVLIEGGSAVNWAALTAGVVDKVFLYYAPLILGSSDAVPFARAALRVPRSASEAQPGHGGQERPVHLELIQLHRIGDNIAIEAYVRK